jgi:MoxR-like ATPase
MAKQTRIQKKGETTNNGMYTKKKSNASNRSGKDPSYLSEAEIRQFHSFTDNIIDNLERVIRGKRKVLEYLVTGLIAGGHILIEDVPGLGKTTLAKTLAHLISRTRKGKPVVFKRIQFTPDLLPYDITGVDIYDQKNNTFVFYPGPAFANILLADEINRTTPKVQSALLEVMAENQITIGNRTHTMDAFFFVIATQNPVETEGTYPLPLAQIDRFLMKIRIGYPDEEVEIGIVKDDPAYTIMPHITPVCGKEDILNIRHSVNKIYCDERLIRVAVNITAATRKHRGIELGASPRASLMLIKAARAYALINGRSYIIDQDIVDIAPLVVAHRLRLKALKLDAEALVRELTLEALQKITY